ncbi:hypothetical protein SD71_09320 [Cohnella kolymensis]|uniref:Prepilin-type N-terminal cleavage/methylation domain-containing protein n=1 Tax=Cohnella kolymensis TaxID=1590652 RepID=A0ABR5A530_9BACL|nr:hypothetical protein SD71_09320 [Cohnella kolymensis]
MLRNEKGISLYEVLATLAIASFLIGTLTFLFTYSHNGMQQTASRETILRESRTIMSHIVTSVRNETATADVGDGKVLKLEFEKTNALGVKQPTGDTLTYNFTPQSSSEPGKIEVVTIRRGQTTKHELSAHVANVHFEMPQNNKLQITLTMQLPNGDPYETSTVVYFPRLKIT